MKKFLFPVILFMLSIVFFWQFFFKGLLPIPSDTIVGLYHPFRDLYAKDYPRGIPFKNFLISDPVRQIIPWKNLSIESLTKFELPLWNPYEMAGKPHLANFQSSPFYPLNLVLLIKPFNISWSIFIMLQPILAGLFMFFYLRNLKLDSRASILGSIVFSFSGFSITWLEWGNIVHTALWLPLILLSIDKVFERNNNREARIINNWGLVFLSALVSSFFAGHLQIFFYVFIISLAYLLLRWFEYGKKLRSLRLFAICYSIFAILTAIQWIPTLQFINLSARSLDQSIMNSEGWFIPWQHLVQFLFPDFFGNPTTLNYWGTWNYGELAGYVGIITLFFVVLSLISEYNRTKLFFVSTIIIALLFSTDNPIARIPFELNIPLISSSQPTRLIFLITFSLSVFAAIGFDFFLKLARFNKVLLPILISTGVIVLIWLINISNVFEISTENLAVLKRNLVFPTAVFGMGLILILIYLRIKNAEIKKILGLLIIAAIAFDLLRFGWKFTPFTKSEYFYPQTKIIEFLKKDKDIYRIATTDSRILAPNLATYYKIQSIEGYDPLYLKSYADLISASERKDFSYQIDPKARFNRIITPHNVDSIIIDLLNVKYVLSLTELNSNRFEEVFREGKTIVYRNKGSLPRIFFVEYVIKNPSATELFNNYLSTAIIEGEGETMTFGPASQAKIISYKENKIVIETNNTDGFLVLSDPYYPTWRAEIDGKRTEIHRTNYAFRGIFVPAGKHILKFENSLL